MNISTPHAKDNLVFPSLILSPLSLPLSTPGVPSPHVDNMEMMLLLLLLWP
jgi:hypothetical protein